MALNFPSAPTNGQVYTDTASGNRYVYDSGNTTWKFSSTPYLSYSTNNQILFDDFDIANGSNGMMFSKTANTVYFNNIATTQNVTASYFFGDGSRLVNIPTFAYANGVANSANAYAVTVGTAANVTHYVYANSVANSANISAYVYANGTANSANAYAGTLYTSSMINGNSSANSANAYTVTVGTAGNNYAAGLTTNMVRNNQTSLISTGYTVASFNAGANIAAYGTWTPNPANGNYQYITISGGVTVAAPTTNCAIDVLWQNSTGVTAVLMSGYQINATPGDTWIGTSGTEFILSIRRINNVSTYVWKALQ